MTALELANKIKMGEIDCNTQQSFFSSVFKGLLLDLNQKIYISGKRVPHIITHTGDSTMWLMEQDYDFSKEPYDITNVQSVYQQVPRCEVTPSNIDIRPDQISNPYSRTNFQIEYEDQIFTMSGEMRRMPINVNVELTYYSRSFNEMLLLIQNFYANFTFIRTYKVQYLGQVMTCSYMMPTSLTTEYLTDLNGLMTESIDKKIHFTLVLESNMPIFNPDTIVPANHITQPISTLYLHNTGNIENNKLPKHEVDTRNAATSKGYRGSGSR